MRIKTYTLLVRFLNGDERTFRKLSKTAFSRYIEWFRADPNIADMSRI